LDVGVFGVVRRVGSGVIELADDVTRVVVKDAKSVDKDMPISADNVSLSVVVVVICVIEVEVAAAVVWGTSVEV